MRQLSFDQISDDMDRMTRMSCALESYMEILSSAQVDASSEVGLALQVGLEAIDPTIDIKEGSAITLRAMKDGLVKLAKMIRQACRTLFEFVGSMYVKFTGSLSVVRGRHKRVGKRLGKLGRKSTYSKMMVSGISRLSVDGKFVGSDVAMLREIQQLTDFILNVYPKAITQISRDSARSFQNIIDAHPAEGNLSLAKHAIKAFEQSLNTRMRLPTSFVAVSTKETGGEGGSAKRSPVMPGNYAMVVDLPNSAALATENPGNYATLISNAFSFKFTELSLNVPDKTEREIEVPSIQELNSLYSAINDILSLAERGETGQRDYATVKTVIDDAINQIGERSTNVSPANNVMIHMLGAMSKKLAEPVSNFLHWLAVTMNVYISFMNHCLEHYREEGV